MLAVNTASNHLRKCVSTVFFCFSFFKAAAYFKSKSKNFNENKMRICEVQYVQWQKFVVDSNPILYYKWFVKLMQKWFGDYKIKLKLIKR